MAIKIKARQTLMYVGKHAGQYRFTMTADTYSKLSDAKVIQEAALRSGIAKGSIKAAYDAIGEVLKAWATEGHSVAIPGLGTMRFGVRADSVEKVEDVGAHLITARRVIFTPSVDIKDELRRTSISISCYDKDGNLIKNVTSSDDAEVEDNEQVGNENNTQQPTLYTLTFSHNGTTQKTEQLAQGATITAPSAPTGYHWKDVPATMPANNLTVVSEQDDDTPPALE